MASVLAMAGTEPILDGKSAPEDWLLLASEPLDVAALLAAGSPAVEQSPPSPWHVSASLVSSPRLLFPHIIVPNVGNPRGMNDSMRGKGLAKCGFCLDCV